MADLSTQKARKTIVDAIKNEENKARKREQQKRFDVYNDRQDVYILERLRREFSEKTVNDMRKILSINLAKRIIDEKSSVYSRPVRRDFYRKGGEALTDLQITQIENLYKYCKVDLAMKRANLFYNLHDQCSVMVVPDNVKGGLKIRAIPPMHYDVIPREDDPELADAYILNTWDFDLHKTAKDGNEPTQLNQYRQQDRRDSVIADDDDRMALLERYIVWDGASHFVMNGKGEILTDSVENPVSKVPFVDVAPYDKDFQFFVRRGSSTVDFCLDYGMMLSDNANVIRLQAYSQAVISSEQIPTNFTVGPNHILHLKLDPRKPELRPDFQFVTPNPDLAGTQTFLESMLSLHLTSEGQDPSILSTKGEGQKFNSGLDRLLAMISKFEATRDDFDLFRSVESQVLGLMVEWSNEFQLVNGESAWPDELRQAILPDDLAVSVKYSEPEGIQTKAEKEDSIIKLLNEGLMSQKEAIMDLREVNEDRAVEILSEINGTDQGIESNQE